MIEKPVCIVGCGPIGLSAALLLNKLHVPTLLVERRTELNPHPRSRFVDTNTMELMRLLGIEKEVERTGLGSDWTAVNRWSKSLVDEDQTAIPAPTFHTVPRDTSPCLPIMTCQDYVEHELMQAVERADLIDCRFNTEASDLKQSESCVELNIRNLETGEREQVRCEYLIGADGPHSGTRVLIGSELASAPMPLYSQDIIFDADLSEFVGEEKGSLLYCLTEEGVSVFQPLDGKRRWRIQLFKPEEADLTEEQIVRRIRLAVGDERAEINLTSVGHWQPTPGCTSKLREGRIFLAGDAAHVAVPTGGMGNNIGFLGARNLTWKLAYVVQGYASDEIFATYEAELKPAALKRIGHGVNTTQCMAQLIGAIFSGADRAAGIEATSIYADYDGVILGHETQSSLVAPEPAGEYEPQDPVREFQPLIRNGRRAPHVWLDRAENESILDSFVTDYTLVVGAGVATERWQAAVAKTAENFPIALLVLPETEVPLIYAANELVLVRPDGIIADHWSDESIGDDGVAERLTSALPQFS